MVLPKLNGNVSEYSNTKVNLTENLADKEEEHHQILQRGSLRAYDDSVIKLESTL